MTLKISTGKKQKPYFMVIYGVDKVGKTSFAADAPNPVFVGPEQGSNHLDTSRLEDVTSWDALTKNIDELITDSHEFKTVALDSLDWIEQLLFKHICDEDKVETIGDSKGGYGKGYDYAITKWVELINKLETLRSKRNMNIIAIAHSHVKTFNDPNQTLPYDRYMLKLNDKAAAKWREAVDCVLFANFEDTVFKLNKSDKKAKVTGGETRKLYTQRRAAFDAGNRLDLPPELPLSWEEFDRLAKLGQPDSLKNIQEELGKIVASLPDTNELKPRITQAITKANGDVTQLSKILNHSRAVVGDQFSASTV